VPTTGKFVGSVAENRPPAPYKPSTHRSRNIFQDIHKCARLLASCKMMGLTSVDALYDNTLSM